jgi:hypothetical protein
MDKAASLTTKLSPLLRLLYNFSTFQVAIDCPVRPRGRGEGRESEVGLAMGIISPLGDTFLTQDESNRRCAAAEVVVAREAAALSAAAASRSVALELQVGAACALGPRPGMEWI